MRRRLLITLTLFAAVAVCAFAVPLAVSVATSRTQVLWQARLSDLERFASLAALSDVGGRALLASEVASFHRLYGENVLVVDASGAVVTNAGMDLDDPEVVSGVAGARRNQPPRQARWLRPWDPDRILFARPIGTGVQVSGAVLLDASTRQARRDIGGMWLGITLGSTTAMALFTALALMLSQWVLSPLATLSASVARLTSSLPEVGNGVAVRRDRSAPSLGSMRYGGPPEVRELSRSFDAMAVAVTDSVSAQRNLIADTAHSLRNPLAALAIRLESLEEVTTGTAQRGFQGATAEVERLTGLLTGLLDLAAAETPRYVAPEAGSIAGSTDAVQVAQDRVDAWLAAFERAGIDLTVRAGPDQCLVAVPQASLAQILDVALSNSCRYAGQGASTEISVDAAVGWVSVSVSDTGAGVAVEEMPKLTQRFYRGTDAVAGGSGLGLPIAAALAHSCGGILVLDVVEPHGLAVMVRFREAV